MRRVAIDTNVLVYRYDPRDPVRHSQAKAVIGSISRSGGGIIPVQCLAEFSNVGLRKLGDVMTPNEVREAVDLLRTVFETVPLTAAVVLEALRGVADHQMSYYDAQVWAAARLAQAEVLVSEDFNSGSSIGNVTFVNPFDGSDPDPLIL